MRWGGRSACLLRALALLALTGCAREVNDGVAGGLGGAGSTEMDGGSPFGNANQDAAFSNLPDAAHIPRDADLSADAFFAEDPPPLVCMPGEEPQHAEPPGGTPDCPDDKNRQGCPCPEAGMTAPCWPGKRIHRGHGVCKDGVTTCLDTTEFGNQWGPCEGYVLPDDSALAGPNACRCFSSGTWTLENLGPCILVGDQGTYLYSSTLTPQNTLDCGSNVPEPPPVPSEPWTASTLRVDCAGEFRLCYTIKAGDSDDPRSTDCVVVESCLDVVYPEAEVEQALPALPAWVSSDTECAARFVEEGGYGEMSVLGRSVECDAIDDGEGQPYVFHRTRYCPPSCQNTPDSPECRSCTAGGSGMFD